MKTLPALAPRRGTFKLDTSGAYAANDVLSDVLILENVAKAVDQPVLLVAMRLTDEDDQAAADMDVIFFDAADASLGTTNSAVTISDQTSRRQQGRVRLEAAEWDDDINSKSLCCPMNHPRMGVPLFPIKGTRHVAVQLVTKGTPTQTAYGIQGLFWFMECEGY